MKKLIAVSLLVVFALVNSAMSAIIWSPLEAPGPITTLAYGISGNNIIGQYQESGEGPQHGKYLFYRCNDRVTSFPLPRKCFEKGINAREADELVWRKILSLMTSPELLSKQVERWMNNNRTKNQLSHSDTDIMEKEIVKLKEQEERYNKAYGAGLISIEQLKDYTAPIREKIFSQEIQISKSHDNNSQLLVLTATSREINKFASRSVETLQNLSFTSKKAIIHNVIEKVVATTDRLQVNGYIPIISNVEYKTNNRNSRATKCRKIDTF